MENGDWHSANFIILESEKSPVFDNEARMVHIDWGAARPLKDDELTAKLKQERLYQVKNIAFSFHDEEMASKVQKIHDVVTSNKKQMTNLRELAATIVNQNSTS